MRTGWDLTYQHGCVVMVRAVSWVPFSRRERKAFRGVLFSSQCQDWLFICFVVWWRTCWKQGVRAGIGTQVPLGNSPSGRSCWIRSPPQAIKSGPYRIWDSAVHRVLPHFSYTCRNRAPVTFLDWSALCLAMRTPGTVDTRSLSERSGCLTLEKKECVHELYRL